MCMNADPCEGKICIMSQTPEKLQELTAEMGLPKYRAGQIFRWLYRGIESFDQMTDQPAAVRRQLEERFFIQRTRALTKKVSRDGTVKYLLELMDGNAVETVLMQYQHGTSLCISTQAGCKMGCIFCASYERERPTRNLTPAEMLIQLIYASRDTGERIDSLVLMGTGEPLDNYDNVMDFLHILSQPEGLGLGMRHVSLSTCGLVPKIRELAERKMQITLSISLHAPTNELRSELMPVNRRYPLEMLIPACRDYFAKTGRRISFEYAMISGVNDTPECARQLASLLSGLMCHINLIPLNHVEGSPLMPSTPAAMKTFQDILKNRHMNVTVRRRLGPDIDAACGQLRRKGVIK